MNLVKIKCAFCGKEYFRQAGRVNEAIKFGWNQYCSQECQNKAKTTRVEKVCGNLNCNKLVSRALNQFKRSKSELVFCSQSCAAIFNNKKCLKGHAKIKPKLKTCAECGKSFRKNPGDKKYCSTECRRQAQWYYPEKLLEIIKKEVRKLGRIPTRRELGRINSACRRHFGSWNNAVLAAGFTPNRSHDNRMYKRSNAKALDGHLCDSVSELLIDNWLYKNNVPHERNVSYPGTNHKADWEIISKNQKIFVEYFGLANDSPRYDRAVREKKRLCRKYNLTLIAIYPQDLYSKENFTKKLRDEFKDLTGVKFGRIQDAGNRTQASPARGVCTTAILHPDKI